MTATLFTDPPAITLGIDPGGTGAIAALDQHGQLLWVEDMPVHDGIVSGPLAANILVPHRQDVVVAWVENVHSMPKQGVSSSFKFGRAFGTIEGVLGGALIPVEYVAPSKWKTTLGLSKDKDASRRRAVELWPAHAARFARVKDDGRAEAALIARYGQQLRGQGAA